MSASPHTACGSSSLSVLVLAQIPLCAQMRHAKERKMDFLSLEFGVTASSLWKVANRRGIRALTGDRQVDELPCQGEGSEKASFAHKKPTDRARRGKLMEPKINSLDNARYGVALSLPSVVGRQGVVETFLPEMSDDETRALERSAETLRGAVGKYLHKS